MDSNPRCHHLLPRRHQLHAVRPPQTPSAYAALPSESYGSFLLAKLDQAVNTEKRIAKYCKYQYKLLKELYNDIEAHYIALKKLTKNNTIGLSEKRTDIPIYLQIPSEKPKSPWDDAHVLEPSIQVVKEMKKEEDTDQDDDEDPKP
jgi:hypothetical protein